MDLIEKIEKIIWDISPTSRYKYVENYIKKWHHINDEHNNYDENFPYFTQIIT